MDFFFAQIKNSIAEKAQNTTPPMEYGPPIERILKISSKDVLPLCMLHDYEDQVCARPSLTPVQPKISYVEYEPPIDCII